MEQIQKENEELQKKVNVQHII